MKSTQNLPLRLKELRNKHNYSQEQLAEILNVSRQAVSRWETGKAVPDIDNMLFLSELYDVPLDYLLGEENPVNSSNEQEISDFQEKVSVIVENIILTALVITSEQLPFFGIAIILLILIWLFCTKRNYKFVYFVCMVCIILDLYEYYIIYTHFQGFYGTSFFK